VSRHQSSETATKLFLLVRQIDEPLYGFLVVRQLEGVGYDFRVRVRDMAIGLRECSFFRSHCHHTRRMVGRAAVGALRFLSSVPGVKEYLNK